MTKAHCTEAFLYTKQFCMCFEALNGKSRKKMNLAVRGKLTKLGNIFDTLLIIFTGYFFFIKGLK